MDWTLILTAIGTVATVISTVIAVRAKNEAKDILKQIKEEHKKLFSGLRFANNCLKHNITFQKAHKVENHRYPYRYSYRYGTYFVWVPLDKVNIEENKENQRVNYKNNLEGKNVCVTMLNIMNIIKEYYETL